MTSAGDRLYEALCWYADNAADLGPQSNSGPPGLWPRPGLGERLRAAPALRVPELDPEAVPNFVDRFRHRYAHTTPTVEEVREWARLLRRHGPNDRGGCSSCRGRVFPCHFWANACGALIAAAGLDDTSPAAELAGAAASGPGRAGRRARVVTSSRSVRAIHVVLRP